MQKRVFLKHGSRYDAHFKLNANRGRVHSFQLYEKGCEEGGGGFPTLNFKYFNSADIFGISVLSLWYGVLFIYL